MKNKKKCDEKDICYAYLQYCEKIYEKVEMIRGIEELCNKMQELYEYIKEHYKDIPGQFYFIGFVLKELKSSLEKDG